MDNQKKEKKQGKLIPGSKVHVTTVAVISVILVILLAISSFGVAVFSAKPFEWVSPIDGKTYTVRLVEKEAFTSKAVNRMTGSITIRED